MFATSFVLGYHGCERKVGEAILAGNDHVSVSKNVYDWLGHGAYFWENSPKRARDWAQFLTKHPPEPVKKIRDPFVVGAVIDLGNCLDLTDAGSLEIVRTGYEEFRRTMEQAGFPMPTNEPALEGDVDLVKRHLDCAVLNFVHRLREREKDPLDTARGSSPKAANFIPERRFYRKRTCRSACVIRKKASKAISE